MQQGSVSLTPKSRAEILPAGTRLRPLRNQIVVKPLEWRPSAVIEMAGDERNPLRGRIVAVGPGAYERKYSRDSMGQISRVATTENFVPTEVQVGDLVELGGLEIGGYRFQQVILDNELHLICSEKDVCGIVEQ